MKKSKTLPVSKMPITDVPQAMALLRVLNDIQAPLPTAYLVMRAMRNTRTPDVLVCRVRFWQALDRLRKDCYVDRLGNGQETCWMITTIGTDAAVTGNKADVGMIKMMRERDKQVLSDIEKSKAS